MEIDVAPSPDVSKLTVPQLKALCKERRITGYSKLGKAALIQKLAGISSIPSATSTVLPSVILSAVTPTRPISAPLDDSLVLQTSISSKSISTGTHLNHPLTFGDCEESAADKITSAPKLIKPMASTGRSSAKEPSVILRPAGHAEIAPSSVELWGLSTGSKRQLEPLDAHISTPALPKKKKTCPTSSNSVVATSAPSKLPSNKYATASPISKKKKNAPNHPIPRIDSAHSGAFKLPSLLVSSRSPMDLQNVYAPPSLHNTSSVLLLQQPTTPVAAAFSSPRDLAFSERQNVMKVAQPEPRGSEYKIARPTPKRFQPLIVSKPPVPSQILNALPSPQTFAMTRRDTSSSTAFANSLDFPLTAAPPSLVPITLPPTLSQRKRVRRWSIILSGLSDKDRKRCILVSRMFRYAIYLSAAHILTERFPGLRLELLMQNYSLSMTNMWPYLRIRQQEVSLRKNVYLRSFMGKFLKDRNPISERLWMSPDNERQVVVALRFTLTRLWFLLSIGGDRKDPLAWSRGIIVDAQEIVKGEIWSIKLCSGTNTEVFYVLESTCEVVGHPPASSHPTGSSHPIPDSSASVMTVRSDWSTYISQRMLPLHGSPPRPLLDHLKWLNHEEYEKGMSKLWLTRVANEGDFGRYKLVVAERYILASVAGNSVSGKWMSSTQMAQDFAGLPSRLPSANVKAPQVHLFLPTHHHVESLHFKTANGSTLHPALAIVQTPGREYYILKDNGMQVGCEEDGVGEVWMKVLGCDRLGIAVS